MARSKSKRSINEDKAKRMTPAQQRAGIKTVSVEPTNLGPNYKVKPTRRHRGPVTASAVPGTGNSRRKSKQK